MKHVNYFDRQLTEGLHELAAAESLSAAPTRQLLDRGRRARQRRAASLAGTSFAVVALGAVAAVVIAGTPSTAPGGPVGPDAAATSATVTDPRLELVAAIANSQRVSFRLKTTTTDQKGDGKMTVPAYTMVTETAFDPAIATGYVRSLDGFEYRLVNGVLYMTDGGQWLRDPGTYTSLNMDEDRLRGAFVESADSQQLFSALSSGGKVDKTGADTYHFAVTSSKHEGTVTFTGDIVVGADKRIAKVAYDWRLDYGQGGFKQSKVVLEYSGYGEPVAVEAPPNPVPVSAG
ncbi:hypothetical protein Cci01nite_62410 [Catellatospora citrea]|uniref:Uncharacterized protein n=1 Tax=Catellatospora citrea TaxID=53366 RepID=A0A8J3KDW6_9ACTN|nr:hypothetical protein Cci01nite_62410 [Catellatospora citrea]